MAKNPLLSEAELSQKLHVLTVLMRQKLEQNEQNEQKGGWADSPLFSLLRRASAKVLNLTHPLEVYEATNAREDAWWVLSECADVASFALMITDNLLAKHPSLRDKILAASQHLLPLSEQLASLEPGDRVEDNKGHVWTYCESFDKNRRFFGKEKDAKGGGFAVMEFHDDAPASGQDIRLSRVLPVDLARRGEWKRIYDALACATPGDRFFAADGSLFVFLRKDDESAEGYQASYWLYSVHRKEEVLFYASGVCDSDDLDSYSTRLLSLSPSE